MQFNNLINPLNKNVLLKNSGALYALGNGSSTDNTVTGSVAIDDTGGVLNAGGTRTDVASNSAVTMTLSGPITGSSAASLIKTGPGTVILSGSSSFAGTTTLNDGALIVNGYLPGSLTMVASATSGITTTLAGAGTIGGPGVGTVTDASGVIIAPGPANAVGSVGTLTMNNLNLTGGGQINYDLATTNGSDLINLTGNLSLAGTTSININGINTMPSGSYRLINCLSKSGGGTLTLLNVPSNTRRTFTIDNSSSTQVNFSLTGSAGNLTWVGGLASNSWDIVTTANWTGATPNIFYNFDNVTFDDSGNNAVSIYIRRAPVTPASITDQRKQELYL